MAHVASQFTYRMALTVTAALLLATLARAQAPPSHAERVEARITELHAKLHITPAQEDLWQHVTQGMRDNATRMDELTQARAAKAPTMTAVDALKAYSAIAEAHAEGLKTFIPAFEALYARMSDAQKQQADALFRRRSHTRAKGH
jgi:periplasmic protein CpxP/Spy